MSGDEELHNLLVSFSNDSPLTGGEVFGRFV
jgi:hypothetical protein